MTETFSNNYIDNGGKREIGELLNDFRGNPEISSTTKYLDRLNAMREGAEADIYGKLLANLDKRKRPEDLVELPGVNPLDRSFSAKKLPGVNCCNDLEGHFSKLVDQPGLPWLPVRRAGKMGDVRIYVDDVGKGPDAQPLLLEKSSFRGRRGERSAIGLQSILINGVEFPEGTVYAARTSLGKNAPPVVDSAQISRLGPMRFTSMTHRDLGGIRNRKIAEFASIERARALARYRVQVLNR